jgi:hypothetical protein
MFGGPGEDPRNIVPVFRAANEEMRTVEFAIRDALESGQAPWVYYRVTPIYNGSSGIPIGITMEAAAVDDTGTVLFQIANQSVLNK